jgi:diguanylate cyclase (GGDEF)-like protein
MNMDRITALLVEDSQADAQMVRNLLAECNQSSIEIVHATTLSSAIDVLGSIRVKVMLLDLTLPDSNGLDTVTSALAAAPELPIIILTGTDDLSMARSAVTSGAQDYLVKGTFDAPGLERAITHAVYRAETLQTLRVSEISRAIELLEKALGADFTSEGIKTSVQIERIRKLLSSEHRQLPLIPGQVESALSEDLVASLREAARAHHPGKVLVVDDDRTARALLRKQLEDAGFKVETATSGLECIQKAHTWRPEVILLDILMPGMNGIETCRQLKKSDEIAMIPVLFVTGHDDEKTTVEALSAGGNDFVRKGAAGPILSARIRSQVAISRANARLRHMAMTDELTGMFSRRYLYEAMRREIKQCSRTSSAGLACLLADIDNFKRTNDTLGHLAGDRVLKDIAATIRESIRETDSCARFGGEEIVILLPNTDLTGASKVAEKVRAAVETRCVVTISIGVTHIKEITAEDVASPESVDQIVQELLHQSDTAMYNAKEQGRNSVSVYRQ